MNVSKVTKARWPQRQVRWSSRGWVSQAHRPPAKDGPLWCQGNITNTHDDTEKKRGMTKTQKIRFNNDLYEGLLHYNEDMASVLTLYIYLSSRALQSACKA